MSVLEKIKKDLISSIKDKEGDKVQVLRMIVAAAKNKEIEKKSTLSDSEILSILNSEIKKRKEAASLYKKGNRNELAKKEELEIKILSEYMPESLSKEEITRIVKEKIEESQAEGRKNMGRVMSLVMPETKGRADGGQVSRIVNSILGENDE